MVEGAGESEGGRDEGGAKGEGDNDGGRGSVKTICTRGG